jgi:hypothetical protein
VRVSDALGIKAASLGRQGKKLNSPICIADGVRRGHPLLLGLVRRALGIWKSQSQP